MDWLCQTISLHVELLHPSHVAAVFGCRATKMGCTNAAHPDSYGHYREAIVTAIKHHWWWKVSVYRKGNI